MFTKIISFFLSIYFFYFFICSDKTLAVLDIINSLDDLHPAGKSPSHSSVRGLTKTPNSSGKKQQLTMSGRKYQDMNQNTKTNSHQAISKHHSSMPTTRHISPTQLRSPTKPGLPLHQTSQLRARHSILTASRFFPQSSIRKRVEEDAELEVFHLPQFKEDRLDGFRRLANRVTDDSDSDDLVCDYDDLDDSNIDDIVNALSETLTTSIGENDEIDYEEDIVREDDDNIWDAIVSGLNDPSKLKHEYDKISGVNNGIVGGSHQLEGGRHRNRESQTLVDDNDILEDVFFVTP